MNTVGIIGGIGPKSTVEYYRLIVSAYLDREGNGNYIHDIYMGELVKGIFRNKTKNELLRIANNLKEKDGIQGLILGGTELLLILKEEDAEGIEFLDTTKIHVESIMQRLL